MAQIVSEARRTRLTILPIPGTPVHFDAPGRSEDLLVDVSDETGALRSLKPYLRARGINTLGAVVLTHGDIDHVEGFGVIKELFPPEQVVRSAVPFRSPTYKRVAADLRQASNSLQVHRGEMVRGWQVLHPPHTARGARADDKALVLRKSLHGYTFLLLSDLSSAGRNELLNNYPDLKADVLFAGIPEDGRPLNREFLQRVEAKLCVLGIVASGRGFQKDPPWRTELKGSGIPVLLTSETGAVMFEFGRRVLSVKTMSGAALSLPVQKEGKGGLNSSISTR